MRELRRWLHGLLGTSEGRRVLESCAGVLVFIGLYFMPVYVLASGGGHGSGHGAPLHVNWWTWSADAPPVGWFFFDFAIFVGGIYFAARGPINKLFAARHEQVKNDIDEAVDALVRARKFHADYKGKVDNITGEVDALLNGAETDGRLLRDKVIADGKEYAATLERDNGAAIEQEVTQAKERLRAELVESVLLKSRSQLVQDLNDVEQQRLLEESIVLLESGDKGSGLIFKRGVV